MTAVLLTGAGSGIGAKTALRLDRAGIRVFAAVHDPADGEILARGASPGLSVHTVDVTNRASVEALAESVSSQLGAEPLTAVVNVAGEGIAGPLELMPVESLRHQLDVNVVGPVSVTQCAAADPAGSRRAGRFRRLDGWAGRGAVRRRLPRVEVRDRGDR